MLGHWKKNVAFGSENGFMQSKGGNLSVTGYNPPYGKRWRLYILPQYLANLTQPIGTLKVIFFTKFFLVLTVLCMLDLKFSKVFMSVFRVFVRNELWVKATSRHLFRYGGLYMCMSQTS